MCLNRSVFWTTTQSFILVEKLHNVFSVNSDWTQHVKNLFALAFSEWISSICKRVCCGRNLICAADKRCSHETFETNVPGCPSPSYTEISFWCLFLLLFVPWQWLCMRECVACKCVLCDCLLCLVFCTLSIFCISLCFIDLSFLTPLIWYIKPQYKPYEHLIIDWYWICLFWYFRRCYTRTEEVRYTLFCYHWFLLSFFFR